MSTLQQVVAGNLTTSSEEHWYKVYLPANPQTILTLNCIDMYASVYDANLNLLFDKNVTKDYVYSWRAYEVNITTAGWYYIRLYNSTSSNEYRLSVGNNNYSVSYQDFPASVLTLQPGITSAETSIDMTNNTSFPPNSIVYSITIGGVRSARPTFEARLVKYANEIIFSPTNAAFMADFAVSQNKLFKSI